jgi:hypothetical protein
MQYTLPALDVNQIYSHFSAEMTDFDCGKFCASHNPSGMPFCCDICQAVPAVYVQEWEYLQRSTDLWHQWRGDECPEELSDTENLTSETPQHMLLLACQGPAHCQRQYRALSCRQFPFFPYISTDYRFIGLAYEWEFEQTCWVIRNLGVVTAAYRSEFIQTYDFIFNLWQDDLASYAIHSDHLREYYVAQKRRFPLWHRNGSLYHVSPVSERLYCIQSGKINQDNR